MKKLICAIIIGLVFGAIASAVHYVPAQKYGQEFTLHFSVYDSNSPWQYYETAPAADDVYVRKDGGAAVRATNAVTDLNHTMSIVLTATEMTAAVVTIDVNDETAPPLFGSDTWVIYTHGNASAQNAFDLDTATQTVTTGSISNGAITAAAIASNAFTSDELATSFIEEIENDLINSNNTKHSLAWYIKRASGGEPAPVEPDATAQAGGTSNTIVLESASSATDNAYVPMLVELTSGTGAPATRTIISYDGTTKTATVDRNWPGSSPDATTHYKLSASTSSDLAHTGLAAAGDATTITLDSEAPSTSNITGWIVLLSGTGSPDTQEVASYDGSTKVLTVTGWSGLSPSTDTYYALIPTGNIVSDTSEPTPGLSVADVQTALAGLGYDATLATNIGTTNSRIGDPNSGDTLAGDLAVIEAMVDNLEASAGSGTYDVDDIYDLCIKILNAMRY